jgi:outer membrane protein insertion porin family
VFDPKEGSRHSISLEYAGTFLGGDNDYYKTIGDSSRYFPLWRDHVFSLHGRLGYANGIGDKELPVGERFYVGGINTVRGFKFGKAGPITPFGEILGGNKELFFNVEYLIPLVVEARLKLVLFYDLGRAFDDSERIRLADLRKSAGFGIRWISPIGPLRLEWGRNLDPKEGEANHTIEFSIGTLF